ncbi:cytochrome b5, partial [Periconia macrospinosa]
MTWGYNPWWTRAHEWKGLLVCNIYLTDDELRGYDGTDPSKPIYLALNGTIYDVSSARMTYGPGGSYAFFAGRDAARAFLTGCFRTDTTPDLRGVTRMYMPIDPDVAREKFAKMTRGEIKIRNERELREARKAVRDGLEHWHVLFRGDKGKKYRKVGEVKREKDWLKKFEKPELCEQAEKQRPVR